MDENTVTPILWCDHLQVKKITLKMSELTASNSLISSSITTLWYLRFMMAAMDSSLDFISVGPNTTPRLLAAIKFLLE